MLSKVFEKHLDIKWGKDIDIIEPFELDYKMSTVNEYIDFLMKIPVSPNPSSSNLLDFFGETDKSNKNEIMEDTLEILISHEKLSAQEIKELDKLIVQYKSKYAGTILSKYITEIDGRIYSIRQYANKENTLHNMEVKPHHVAKHANALQNTIDYKKAEIDMVKIIFENPLYEKAICVIGEMLEDLKQSKELKFFI